LLLGVALAAGGQDLGLALLRLPGLFRCLLGGNGLSTVVLGHGLDDGLLLLGLNNSNGVGESLRWAGLALGIRSTHDLDLDTKHTLAEQDVASGAVNEVLGGLTGVNHETVRELHALGTSGPKLSRNNNLATLGARLHNESQNTVAGPSDGKTVEELVAKRLALGDSGETTVLDLSGVQGNRVLGELEALLDERCELTDAATLLSKDLSDFQQLTLQSDNMATTQSAISKRRKFVADGVFYAELNEFFQRELAEEGYSGVEVRVTPTVTDIIIRATHTQEVLGEQGRRIRELTSLIQKRFKFPENSVSLYAAKVQNRGLSAVAQCESLRYKLLNGLAVRRACYGVLRFIMESGAKGCEVVVSGKLRAARAKSMKFTDGFMIHSGQPAKDFIDEATRHVLLRQGVLGIKVKIMRGSDPEGKAGPSKTLPDSVTVIEPKEEQPVVQPMSQDYGAKAVAAQQAAEAARQAEQQQGEGEAAPAAEEQ